MQKLVFDTAKNLDFPLLDYILLLSILIACLVYIKKRKVYNIACLHQKTDKTIQFNCKFIRFFIPTFLFLALSMFSMKVYMHTKMFFHIKSVIKEKKYNTILGDIKNFIPMPYTGHMNESFDVNNVSFEYSDYSGNNYFFRQTKSHGGPIVENGQKVNIHYISFYYTGCLPFVESFGVQCPQLVNNKIIKLWIYE